MMDSMMTEWEWTKVIESQAKQLAELRLLLNRSRRALHAMKLQSQAVEPDYAMGVRIMWQLVGRMAHDKRYGENWETSAEYILQDCEDYLRALDHPSEEGERQ